MDTKIWMLVQLGNSKYTEKNKSKMYFKVIAEDSTFFLVRTVLRNDTKDTSATRINYAVPKQLTRRGFATISHSRKFKRALLDALVSEEPYDLSHTTMGPTRILKSDAKITTDLLVYTDDGRSAIISDVYYSADDDMNIFVMLKGPITEYVIKDEMSVTIHPNSWSRLDA